MMTALRCKHRLPDASAAGALDWDILKERAAQYPHLRPCPKEKTARGGWKWIDRKNCEQCPDAVREREA